VRLKPAIRNPEELARSFHARAAKCQKMADEEGSQVLRDELLQLSDFLDRQAKNMMEASASPSGL